MWKAVFIGLAVFGLRTAGMHVGAGCHVAVGGLARYEDGGMSFVAGYASGGRRYVIKLWGEDPREVGRRAAEEIRKIREGD